MYRDKLRLRARVQQRLIEWFVAGSTARVAVAIVGVQSNTAIRFIIRLRRLIAQHLPFYVLDGEVEADESYFGGVRKGKRGRVVAGQIAFFALLVRGGKVVALVTPNTRKETLLPIFHERVRPHSIVYTDGFRAYRTLDEHAFYHRRIDHERGFADRSFYINRIENF